MRHEAAHFLTGYLCGLPIKSYKADGGTTLVEFYDSAEGDMGGRALKFTPEEVDQVSAHITPFIDSTTIRCSCLLLKNTGTGKHGMFLLYVGPQLLY